MNLPSEGTTEGSGGGFGDGGGFSNGFEGIGGDEVIQGSEDGEVILPDDAVLMIYALEEDGLGGINGEWSDFDTFPCALLQATKMTGFKSAFERVEGGELKATQVWYIAFSLRARWIVTPRTRLRIPPEDDLTLGRPAEIYEVIATDAGTSNTSAMVAQCVKIERNALFS